MFRLPKNEPKFTSPIIEENIRNKRLWRMGYVVKNMNYFQRLWWTITGKSKFMTYDYWENKK